MNNTGLHIDILTGIPGRAALAERLDFLSDSALQGEDCFALIMLDLDYFKSINDAFGHPRGDQVLAEFVRRAQAAIRTHDEIFRYGGDEFVILLPHTTPNQATVVVQRLLDDVSMHPFAGDPPLTISISVGMAFFPNDGRKAEDLFAVADRRSFQAKRAGRGRAFASDQSEQRSLIAPERLIDRDIALLQLHTFLAQIGDRTYSLLQLIGPAGVGRSRMLQEAARAAAMRGLPTLFLRGDAALSGRVYGVFTQVEGWADLPRLVADPLLFMQGLHQALTHRSTHTLLILIDNAELFDRASLELIRGLATNSGSLHLGLIVTDVGWAPERYVAPHIPNSAIHLEQIRLEPISDRGLRAWMRHSLHWEPPAELLDWFADITGRLPRRIEQALERLVATNALERLGDSWIYHADTAHLAAESLTLPAPVAVYHIPLLTSDVVGRAVELQLIAEQITHQRVIMLYGPGGIGKSRLAAQAAIENVSRFAGGAWWVSLANLTAYRQLIPAIANAMGLDVAGAEDPLERLLMILRARATLLVLDDVDLIGTDIEILITLLQKAPLLHLLITTRIPLPIDGLALPITGLLAPAAGEEQTIDTSEAVQLFVLHAKRVNATFNLNETTRLAVAQICRLVDGLPLGIELAAAQSNNISCVDIAADLATNLLGNQQRSGLVVVIEGFWRLLGKYEQLALSRLGIFTGGFSVAAANEIAEASPFFLNALHNNGYLRRTISGRYELHELLRQYGIQQLELYPLEYAATAERHLLFFSQFANQAAPQLLSTRSTHDQMRAEMGNLRIAWDYATRQGQVAELATLSLALIRFATAAGLLADQLAAMDETVAVLLQQGAIEHDPGAMALFLAHYASLLYALSRYPEAHKAAEQSLKLARIAINREAECYALIALGNTLIVQTQSEDAYSLLTQAVALANADQQHWLEATALISQAYAANGMRRYAEARQSLRTALELFRMVGDLRGNATAFNALGNLSEDRGDPTALQFYEQALQIYRLLGDRDGESGVLHNMGVIEILVGHDREARTLLEEALRGFLQLGSRFGEGITRYNLGRAARNLGEWAEAKRQFLFALNIIITLGNRELQISIRHGLAQTYLLQGLLAEARTEYIPALRLAHNLKDRRSLSRVMAGVARLEVACGRPKAALRLAQRALVLAEIIDHPLFQSEALLALAEALKALKEDPTSPFNRAITILHGLGLDLAAAQATRQLGK